MGVLAGGLGALLLLTAAILFLIMRAMKKRQRQQETADRAALAIEKHPNVVGAPQPPPPPCTPNPPRPPSLPLHPQTPPPRPQCQNSWVHSSEGGACKVCGGVPGSGGSWEREPPPHPARASVSPSDASPPLSAPTEPEVVPAGECGGRGAVTPPGVGGAALSASPPKGR